MDHSKCLKMVTSVVVAWMCAACGDSGVRNQRSPVPASPVFMGNEVSGEHQPEVPEIDEGPGRPMSVRGVKGRLSPYDINQEVATHSQALSACFRASARKKPYVGGTVELGFTVAIDGVVKTVRVESSSVGAWSVERCLLDIGLAMQFVKPIGGEADFTVPLEFEARRTSHWWPEDRALAEVGPRILEFTTCQQDTGVSAPESAGITLYVGRRGQILSVGMASSDKRGIDAAWADCVIEIVKTWTLTAPRGNIAKLEFRYKPE